MYNKRTVGSLYEDMAVEYLENSGYEIVTRNFFNGKNGEIDIIARDGKYLAIIEVKYRRDHKKGSPLDAITYYKKRRIINATKYYLHKYRYSENQPVRFDVISITGNGIELIKDAFWVE